MLSTTRVLLFLSVFTTVKGRLDPEVKMNVPEMIRHWGYPVEEHKVVTQDGYILKIHRIPYGKKEKEPNRAKLVVLLQHGLLCSSSVWVSNLPNESLGFILADVGFDVWLGNVRGNTYGLAHQKFTPKHTEFWDFTWDEMALFDFPAMINYILNTTQAPSLGYLGHSQGTLMAFAGLAVNEELASKLNVLIAFGPVATLKHITSPVKYIAPLAEDVEKICQFLGRCGFDFLPSDLLMKFFAKFVCAPGEEDLYCENILFLLCGYDFGQLNRTRLPVYIAHTPAGTSTKNIIHFGQMVESGKCQRYNYYDTKKNLAHYNQTVPPLYHLHNVHVPTVLYYGSNDWLADKTDTMQLARNLPNVIHMKEISKWEHLDFIWGLDAAELVYKPSITFLKEFASKVKN